MLSQGAPFKQKLVDGILLIVILGILDVSCGGGGGSSLSPPPPRPSSATYSVQAKDVLADLFVDNETIILDHGPTGKTVTSNTVNLNHEYELKVDTTVLVNPSAASTLKAAQGSGGNNSPFYRLQRTEASLGATSKALNRILLLMRFTEPGTGPGTDLLDWYTFETGAMKEVNWTYPIDVYLNENDPTLLASGRAPQLVGALRQGLDSWEACSADLTGKLFKYVATLSQTGFEVRWVSSPNLPCGQPQQQVVGQDNNGNTVLIKNVIEVNTLCVVVSSLVNDYKHEWGHMFGFGPEDPNGAHIMNPGFAVNDPIATQSPTECQGIRLRFRLPIGFDKAQWSK